MHYTSNDVYEGLIPSQPINTKIKYQIIAKDVSPLSNEAKSDNRTFYVTDGNNPYVEFYCSDPIAPKYYQLFDIKAEAWDLNGIDHV